MALASPTGREPMSEARIIKKYPNRRLSTTRRSAATSPSKDVKRLVLERADFRVVDARSSDDITRGILQIISEQEEQGNPDHDRGAAHIIRFCGDTLQGMMGYLEKPAGLRRPAASGARATALQPDGCQPYR